MLNLFGVTEVLELITDAVTPVTAHASYIDFDGTNITPGRKNTAIAAAATTTIAPAPANTVKRNVKSLHIKNNDAVLPVTVTLQKVGAAGTVTLLSVVLAAEESLQYVEGVGFRHLNANGIPLSSGAASVTSNELSVVNDRAAAASAAAAAADVHASVASAAATSADQHANAASQAASAADVHASVASAAATSADAHASVASLAATSADVHASTASAAATAADAHANTASAAATSVDARLNNVSARSAGASVKGLQSVVDTLSNAVSREASIRAASVEAASAAASAADAHASTASLAATSADAHASVASLAATSADAHAGVASAAATSVLNFIQGISARSVGNVSTKGLQSVVNALSNQISVEASIRAASVSNEASIRAASVSVVSAAVTSVETHASTASAAATSADAHAAAASAAATSALNRASAVSDGVTSVLNFVNGVSVKSGGTSVKGLQSVVNTLSNRISAIVAGGGISVTSTELSAASAQAASAISVTSAAVTSVLNFVQGVSARSVGNVSTKGLQSVVNALSNQISVEASIRAASVSNEASIRAASVSIVSAAVTSVETHASAASAAATSALNFVNGISARSVGNVSTKGLQSAVNALSNQISVEASIRAASVSNEASIRAASVSIVSAAVTSVETHASTASAAATSADAHAAAASAAATSVLNFVNGVSVRSVGNVSTKGLQSVLDALSNRISATAGGTGSVTSTEVSAVSAQAASAISVVSAAVTSVLNFVQGASVKSGATSVKGLQSVLNTLSNKISASVAQVSATLESHINVVSLTQTSIYIQGETMSAAAGLYSAGAIVAKNSNFISGATASAGGSDNMASPVGILLSTVSAGAAGGRVQFLGAVSLLSNQVSILTGGAGSSFQVPADYFLGNAKGTISTVPGDKRIYVGKAIDAHKILLAAPQDTQLYSIISALSQRVSVASSLASAADAHASAASLAATSADAHAAAASAAATSALNRASAVSDAVTSVLNFVNGVSVKSGATSVKGLQSVLNTLSNRISAAGGGAGSVTSTELSAVSAQAASANNVLSGRVDSVETHVDNVSVNLLNTDSVVSVLKNQVSALSGKLLVNAATIAGSIAITATGLTVCVDPSAVYEYHAMLLVSVTTGQPVSMTWTAPGLVHMGGRVMAMVSVSAGGPIINGLISLMGAGAYFNSAVNIMSVVVGQTAGIRPIFIDALFKVSATQGVVGWTIGTSTGQTMALMPGSFVRVLKLA